MKNKYVILIAINHEEHFIKDYNMEPIIKSILDNDLYKFTMQQAVLQLFPQVRVSYKFKNRGEQRFDMNFLSTLKQQIELMSSLHLTDEEYSKLPSKIPFFKPQYLEYLRSYRYDPSEVVVSLDHENNLVLDIDGKWHRTILWEVPLMALISELYFKTIDTDWEERLEGPDRVNPIIESRWDKNSQRCKAVEKWSRMMELKYAEFGTRRRRSYATQDCVIKAFVDAQAQQKSMYGDIAKAPFIGTSNVHFALKYDVKVIGTMAHEWPMGNSVLEGLRNANYYSMTNWKRVYTGDLGIAIPDTFGTDAFFANFTLELSKLYDGVRHDSGDPFEFTDKTIAHYKGMDIDPLSKTIVFSDGLDVDFALDIANYCKGKIKCSFGIGTHFTNDYPESKALNMVIKLWSVTHNGLKVHVVKIPDTSGKIMGDPDAVKVALWTFQGKKLEERKR